MSSGRFRCAYCRQWASQKSGAVNRARKIGAPLYCDRHCAGLARRKHKTIEQRKAEKAAYDREYRAKNLVEITAKKRAHFQRTYDPVAAAAYRKSRMHLHVEYCQRPEYVAWKREYDRQYRAKEYGPFAEAYLLSIDLNRTIKQRNSNYEIRQENGTWGKAQRRKRDSAPIVRLGS